MISLIHIKFQVINPRKLSLLFIKISKNAPLLLIHSYRIYNVSFNKDSHKKPYIYLETDKPSESIKFPKGIGKVKDITNNPKYGLKNLERKLMDRYK